MQFYWLTLGILAVWRITHLLQAEDGPWDSVVRLRLWLAGWGRLLDCFYCLSIWVALPIAIAIGSGLFERLLLWPALSGGAVLLQRLTEPASPAAQVEEILEPAKEDDDALLRK